LISRRKLRQFWAAYRVAGDQTCDLDRFIYLTRSGRVMHFEIRGFGHVLARFGVEYSHDSYAAYVTVLYFDGEHLELYFEQLAKTLYGLAASIVPPGVKPRCKVKGRAGWPRFLKRHGLVIDPHTHLVSGWQEYFRHG
jgi:hypothetical protein